MSAEASVGFAAPDDNSIGPVWSRTVIKAAPTCFTVEVLPPTKQGKAYSYGIRVIPVNPQQLMRLYEGDDFDPDNGSIRSVGREYEIWRRWDDCLDFQSKLETEFERMSREKKRQLQSGKKVNGRTLYSNPNAGASFESLPEGPDPRTVKIDLHAYVPRLTKKSSFFGNVSDATIQKRGEEFAAVIYGLFKADCVKLIEELRDSVPAREFFAWWRRDEDRMEKQGRRPASSLSGSKSAMAPASVSRFSMDTSASTVFTTPSSPDSPGFSMLRRQQKIYQFPQRSPTESSSSPTATSPSIVTKSPQLPIKHLPSPPTSPEQIRPSRSPVPFLGPPTMPQRPVNVGRPMEPMRYPDNRLLSPQSLQPSRPPQLPTPTALSDRGGRFFSPRELQEVGDMHSSGDASSDSSSPPTPTQATFPAEQRRERPVSQMSMESINSIDYNIDLSFIKLDAPPLGTGKARVYGNRDSVASFMSVDSTRTVDSMAGVLPRSLSRQSHVSQRRRRRRDGPWSPDSRLSLAVPEDAEARYYSDEDSLYDGADLESNFDTMSFLDNLDAFPGVPAPPVADDEVMLQYARDRDWRLSFPTSVRDSIAGSEYDMYDVTEPSSPTSTISGVPLESESGHSTHSAGSNGTVIEPGMCSVKAKYDDTIVALRVPLGTPLSTLRAKLSEKFIQAQGVQLHYRFSIAYFPPSQGLGTGDGMPILISPAALEFEGIPQGSRSSVASSVRPRDSHCESSNLHKLVPIWSQDDWDSALQRCGNKVVLHIIDQDLSP